MSSDTKKPRLVFDFVRSPRQRLAEVESGEAPRESLLGYVQLQERGWPISTSDDRWSGGISKLREKLKNYIELPSIKMIKHWQSADIIVVTTRVSLVLAVIAKLLNKKLVFLDTMCEEIPKRTWRRVAIKLALRLADAVICYSASQAKHWSESLNLPDKTFTPLNYFVDQAFYKLPTISKPDEDAPPYILSVGRDPHRDFTTLVKAADTLQWDLVLVTLPYLVPDGVRNNPRVKILEKLSYDELFAVYGNARVVVVPIKTGTTYMSGIRATMEAMLLKVPVVASRVSGMKDYFNDGEELVYFEPEKHQSLVQAIRGISDDVEIRDKIVQRARDKIMNFYTLTSYADDLERILLSL